MSKKTEIYYTNCFDNRKVTVKYDQKCDPKKSSAILIMLAIYGSIFKKSTKVTNASDIVLRKGNFV